MLIGMGMVYAFLALLIIAIKVMSACVKRFFPDLPASPVVFQQGDDPGIIAAIAAAVNQYRTKHPKH